MPPTILVTFIASDLLIIVGLVAFFLTGASHVTALIPTIAGAILQAVAAAAFFIPPLRFKLMTVVAVLGALGVLAALGRPVMKLLAGEALVWNAAFISQVIMALGCAVVCSAATIFLLGSSK